MSDARTLSVLDPAFPPEIRELVRPPDALRVRGELPKVPGVAIVGTRQPSERGLAYAKALAATLASAGLAIWSGGAEGIDQAAHEGALSVGGLTVLVPGGGLAFPYPPGSEPLWDRVVANGAIAAVVDDRVQPMPWIFLARNGVLAAATRATILVECPLRSGARSTTGHARRLGRPIYVVPQHPSDPFFPAFRDEVRLGSGVLTDAAEVLRVAGEPPRRRPRKPARETRRPDEALDPIEARVLGALGTPKHPDELCDELDLPFPDVQVALARLVLAGRVAEGEAGAFLAELIENH